MSIRTTMMLRRSQEAVLPATSQPDRGVALRTRLREEGGAQAAEYAMLGGVSAAACSGLIALLRNQDTLSTIVEAVLNSLGQFVGSWF